MKKLILPIILSLLLFACDHQSQSEALGVNTLSSARVVFDDVGRVLPKSKLNNSLEVLPYYFDKSCQDDCVKTWSSYFDKMLYRNDNVLSSAELKILKNASDEGDYVAQALYGKYTASKWIFDDANADKGKQLLEASAEKGSILALHSLGEYYFKGIGFELDYVKAEQYLIKAIDKGYVPSGLLIGEVWQAQGNLEKAQEQYRAYAKKGWPEAHVRLGDIYRHGLGVDVYKLSASKFYSSAWDKYQNQEALYNYFQMLINGEAPTKFREQVQEYYDTLIELNDKRILAFMCAEGIKVNRNAKKGFHKEWQMCKKSADQGWLFGLSGLAYLYNIEKYKHYSPYSYKKYMIMSAKAGHAKNALTVGNWYVLGQDGIEKNSDKGFDYLKQSAKLGFPHAMTYLAILNSYPKEYQLNVIESADHQACIYWLNLEIETFRGFIDDTLLDENISMAELFAKKCKKDLTSSQVLEIKKQAQRDSKQYKDDFWIKTRASESYITRAHFYSGYW